MGVLNKFFGTSPFPYLHQHTQKVHQCVELLVPLTEAMFEKDYDKVEELQNQVSKAEHEADVIKAKLRDQLGNLFFLSIGKTQLNKFLTYQDSVADAAEDYAVVLNLRDTEVPEPLQEELREFVKQVVAVSEHLLTIADKLSSLAEVAFSGAKTKKFLENIDVIGQEEWKADKMGRKFSKHVYAMEDNIPPVTVFFLDKMCSRLGIIANSAEKAAKYLHLIIKHK